MQYFESHVQLPDQCTLWKFTSGIENLVLQALHFQKLGICSKFAGGASVKSLLT
jgi:hypothetical protein